MGTIRLTIIVKAPRERCFDLARSIDLHTHSTAGTKEQAVAGVTTGLIGEGQEVTWQAKHFGLSFKLTSRVTELQKPEYFKDIMTRGPFGRMEHEHHFKQHPEGTMMSDVFVFCSPLGFLGTLVDKVILDQYLRGFLLIRNNHIKKVAETDEWKRYLPSEL